MGAKLLSCAYCKKTGCGGKGAVSPEREGGTGASQLAFCSGQCWGVSAAPSGARAEMVGREQGCFVNTNPALGC